MKIVNLTPHALVFCSPSGEQNLTIPPSGEIVRCIEEVQPISTVTVDGHDIPVVAKAFGELQGLPDEQEGTVYVVSALAAQAAYKAGRQDVYCPGDPVRDADGKITGCRSLCGALPK